MEQSGKLIENLKFIYHKGLIHIMGSGFLSKVFNFIGNIFVIRFLTKSEYGTFGYADNIMSFFLILNGLGITYGMLQFCSEQRGEEEKRSIYKFSLQFGMLFNILVSVGVLIYAIFVPLKIPEAKTSLILYAFYPLTYYLSQYFCMLMRCWNENKRYALLFNVNSLIYMLGEIVGAYYLKVSGILLALYLSTLVTGILGMALAGKGHYRGIRPLSRTLKKTIIKYSAYVCANTMISNLLILLDVFLIGYFIADPVSIASYKVGATIPEALVFVPNSIIMFVYPYFAEHNTDREWFAHNAKRLFKVSLLLNLLIAVMLLILAPYIIKILWGARYLSSVTVFRILSINYFVSAVFRINAGNLLATLRKVRLNFYINLIAGASNIVLDIVMIKWMGATGAALATMVVVLITTLMLMPAVVKCIRNIGITENTV